MNKLVYIFMCIGISFLSLGQKKGINYQAVILDPNPLDIPGNQITGQPFQKGKVAIKFTISSNKGVDYIEIQQTETDEFGLINLTIGLAPTNGSLSSNSSSETGAKYSTFDAIVWDEYVKNLSVSVSFNNGKTFTEVSNQKLSYTPYALYTESVDYKNVRDAPTKLSQFSNDPGYLISKDLEPIKADIQSNASQIKITNQTIDENKKSNDAAIVIVNQSITSLDTKLIENSTAIKDNQSSISTINTKLSEQQNQISATNNNLNSQIGGLRGQIRETNDNVNNLSGAAEVVSNKSTAVDLGGSNPSDQLYPSQKATKTYVDQNISSLVAGNIPDATTLAPGKIQLAGDLSGTATNPTVPALANKENTSNKSIDIQGDAGSDSKYPSVKAVKTYVDQATMGTALQATVEGKADRNSPTFTGTPVLPASTIAVTQSSGDNSTNIATTAFVQQATAAGVIDATVSAKGKVQLAGDLAGTASAPLLAKIQGTPVSNTAPVSGQVLKFDGTNWIPANSISTENQTLTLIGSTLTISGTGSSVNLPSVMEATLTTIGTLKLAGDLAGSADLPTVPGLALKAPLDSPTFTGTPSLPTGTIANTQSSTDNSTKLATTEFVKTAINTIASADATATATGKIQLAGDLAGSATAPSIATGAISSTKILDGTILTADLADASVTTDKIADGSIVAADLADASVTDIKIATISGSKVTGNILGKAANVSGIVAIANGGTGTSTKFSGFNALSPMATKGDLIYGENSGEGTRLPKGSEGQVLTMKSGVPSWQNPTNNNSDDDDDNDDDGRTIQDADSDTKGILRLSGDLSGTASSPAVATGAINSVKILNETIATVDLADASVTDAKIATVAGSKVTGNISGNAANVSGIVAVTNGGTGASTLTGYVKGTGASALSASTRIPITDVTGAAPINSPTFTGTPSLPTGTTAITQTSTDNSNKLATTAFVQQVTSAGVIDASTTEKGKLKLAGDLAGTADLPTVPGLALKANTATVTSSLALKEDASNKSNAALGTSTTLFPTQSAVKTYVDAQNTDASSSIKGKIQLAGDLTGTAASPAIATGAVNSSKISDGTIATVDLANAAITDAKIAAVTGSKVTGNISGNAGNVSGTVLVANGGTGANTLASNQVLLGNGTNAIQTVAPGTSGNVLMSNGTTWVSSSNTSDYTAHAIGESYGGGIIFYVYDGGKHGLIAATNDQNNDAKWDLSKGNETRAKANGIGAGIRNTTTIILSSEISQRKSSKDNDWSFDSEDFAAVICNEYSKSETVNSLETTYGDWYLPSKYELNLLYLKRTTVGNFAEDKYWSSTESDEDKAWTINFSTSSNSTDDKTNKNRVRAIRNF